MFVVSYLWWTTPHTLSSVYEPSWMRSHNIMDFSSCRSYLLVLGLKRFTLKFSCVIAYVDKKCLFQSCSVQSPFGSILSKPCQMSWLRPSQSFTSTMKTCTAVTADFRGGSWLADAASSRIQITQLERQPLSAFSEITSVLLSPPLAVCLT